MCRDVMVAAMNESEHSFFSVNLMLKATPVEEGGERILYCEASNETMDAQNEVVLQKALADSMEYMLAKGVFDIDHITMIGAKAGIPDYMLYEIGRPTEINFRDGKTFVKGFIYRGEGRAAERANYFWSSLTDISPPAQWYPSVGGSVLARDVSIDPLTKSRKVAVSQVRWFNIGYSKQPVNQTVPSVQTVPMDVFAKCCSASGCMNITKAFAAGYGTDSATLTDGAALRTQSLEPQVQATLPYGHWRDLLAKKLRPETLANELVKEHNLSLDEARAHVRRFVHDLHTARHGATPA